MTKHLVALVVAPVAPLAAAGLAEMKARKLARC
jgi:hypothetical protein